MKQEWLEAINAAQESIQIDGEIPRAEDDKELNEFLDTPMEGRRNYINDVKTVVQFFKRRIPDPSARTKINVIARGIVPPSLPYTYFPTKGG